MQVRDAVRAECDKAHVDPTEVFLRAFNRQWENFPTMFAKPDMPSGPMPARSRYKRRTAEVMVQLFLYLGPEQEAVLEQAVETYVAGNRSAFVTTLLATDLQVPISSAAQTPVR